MEAPKGLFLSGTLQQSLRKPKSRYIKTHELYQSSHVNVLPRDREVVALKVSAKPKLKDDSYEIKDTARIFVVENPHCNQTTVMHPTAKCPPSKLGEASNTMQVVEHVLDQWRLAKDRGYSDFAFIDHVANFSTLVQRIYGESNEEQRTLLHGIAEEYVLLVCHRKTIRRVELGKMGHKRGRNFFTALTLPTSDFPTINDQDPLDIDDIPKEKRLSALPTEDQTQALYGTLILRGEVSWDEISSQPIYGVNGRRRLHTALAELLRDVDESLVLLRNATDFARVVPVSKERIREIAGLTRRAKKAVRRLYIFSARLEKVLLEHFNWLDETLWIRTNTNFRPFNQTRKPNNAPRNGERGEASEANADAPENHEERGDDTRELDEAIDAVHADLSRRNLDGINVWAREAFAYINLVRLHDQSLFEITRPSENKRLSERIQHCKVAVTTMQRKEFEELHPRWALCVRHHERSSSSTSGISNSPKRLYGIDFKYWPSDDEAPTRPASPPSKRPRI